MTLRKQLTKIPFSLGDTFLQVLFDGQAIFIRTLSAAYQPKF